MERLTFKDHKGQIHVKGMNDDNVVLKTILCIEKLYEYEKTKLSPKEIIELNTFVGSETEKLLAENQELKQKLEELQKICSTAKK